MNNKGKGLLVLSLLAASITVTGCGNKEIKNNSSDSNVSTNVESNVAKEESKKEHTNGVLTFNGKTEEEVNEEMASGKYDRPSGDRPSGDMPSGDMPGRRGGEPFYELMSGDNISGDKPNGEGPSGDATEYNTSIKYYDSLDSMLMALKTGKVDSITVGRSTAKYIVQRNEDIDVDVRQEMLHTSYGMLLLEKNKDLSDKISKAIKELKADGTMDKLVEKYITNANENETVEIAKIEGAQTIKVAITGDLPPMDFVKADGTPSGFNTAVLAKVAQKLGVNIEFIQVNSGARVTALSTERADVVFWSRQLDNQKNGSESDGTLEDVAEGTILTETYYSEDSNALILKKEM